MTLSTPDIERLKGLLEKVEDDGWTTSTVGQAIAALPALLSDRADLEGECERLRGDVANLSHSITLREQLQVRSQETQAHTERLWNDAEARAQAAEAENARLRERATAWRKALDLIDPSKPLQYAQAMHDFRADIDRALLHEGEK